jgi:hypothetical protein
VNKTTSTQQFLESLKTRNVTKIYEAFFSTSAQEDTLPDVRCIEDEDLEWLEVQANDLHCAILLIREFWPLFSIITHEAVQNFMLEDLPKTQKINKRVSR